MITILEGTSGVGKIYNSNVSFDFLKYLERDDLFKNKHQSPGLQSLYELNLYADFFKTLINLESTNVVIDRSPISQIVYSVLFEHNGEVLDSNIFKNIMETKVFTYNYCKCLKHSITTLLEFINLISKHEVNLKIITTTNVDFTKLAIKKRHTFENDSFNLENYIKNQNYLFTKIYKVCGIGELIHVTDFFKQ